MRKIEIRMDIKKQIKAYITSQPEPKRSDVESCTASFKPTRFHDRKLYEMASGRWINAQLQP